MHNPVNRAPYIHHGDCSAIFTMVRRFASYDQDERGEKVSEGGEGSGRRERRDDNRRRKSEESRGKRIALQSPW